MCVSSGLTSNSAGASAVSRNAASDVDGDVEHAHGVGVDHGGRQLVHRADEASDERARRIAVDLGRRAQLLELALRHHADAVADRQRFFLVVRDEQRRDADSVWMRRISSRSVARTLASSADSGSSSSSTDGWIANARARATRCCCPPESWCGYVLACGVSCTSSSISATRRGCRSRFILRVRNPYSTLSPTRRGWGTGCSSGTPCPCCACGRACARCRRRRRRSTRCRRTRSRRRCAARWSCRSRRVRAGEISSPWRTSRSSPCRATVAAERLADRLELAGVVIGLAPVDGCGRSDASPGVRPCVSRRTCACGCAQRSARPAGRGREQREQGERDARLAARGPKYSKLNVGQRVLSSVSAIVNSPSTTSP